MLTKSYEQKKIEIHNKVQNEQVVSKPYLLPLPIAPKIKLIIAVGTVTGFILSIFLAFAIYFFEGHISEGGLYSLFYNAKIIKSYSLSKTLKAMWYKEKSNKPLQFLIPDKFIQRRDIVKAVEDIPIEITEDDVVVNAVSNTSWYEKLSEDKRMIIIFSAENSRQKDAEAMAEILEGKENLSVIVKG